MWKITVWLLFISLSSFLPGCDFTASQEDEDKVSSKAYKGHQSDHDINNFVNAHPEAAGTRLDDCVLCHTGGEVQGSKGPMQVNACDYCHALKRKNLDYAGSLNKYGEAYKSGGRDRAAVKALAAKDTDGDGFSNAIEIKGLTFPGNANSNPAKPPAPYREISLEEIKAMEAHTQLLLMNSHKQEKDQYATYTGVKIPDMLEQAGVNLEGAQGITVFAPDGYAKTFSLEQVTKEYPTGKYYSGLDDAGLGQSKGIVDYPEKSNHEDLQDGADIPDKPCFLLAYQRDFADIPMAYIDSVELRMEGEGPFRSVRPQNPPSKPDRGSSFPKGDEYDYVDAYDHNAGDNVRGVTVIRVDPMPGDYEEFDTMNAGWSFLEQKKIVIYGHGVK